MITAPLTIHLFGPLSVFLQGEPMPRVRTRSVEWLLALLVLRSGRSVSRSWLAGTLWPDSEETQALQNLRNALLSLRKALGSEGERIHAPTRETLSLNLKGAEVDLLRFDAGIRLGEEAALREAVEIHTRPLLEGCQEEWAFLERESRQQACLNALETLADLAERQQDYSEALNLLRRAVGMDSLRDTIQRGLMRVLAATGDTPAALFVYREYRLHLRREMNLEPDAETLQLYQQIRQQKGRGEEEQIQAGPPGVEEKGSRKALGARSDGVSYVSSSPLLPFSSSALPHPITALIGREQAVREVSDLIPVSRLVTLVGGGGVGKTRLSIQVAAETAERFAEGTAFVALAALSDPALLSAFVASALGIREEGTPEPGFMLHALTGFLSTRSILLVLDNCEHLVGATAELCQSLLERCPGLHILATSRQRLGLIGEVAWRVPSLPCPTSEFLHDSTRPVTEAVLEYPAVQLFVERAAMARPGFRLRSREETLEAAQICQHLDGIPLAIELAAARMEILTVGQIAVRLKDRFRLLTGSGQGVLPRHQTLRTLIDWSYELLTGEEQALFGRLSVFAGGWTLEAAEAIWNSPDESAAHTQYVGSDALELIASLINKSLVLAEESATGVRYRMLETVREYAREKLLQEGYEESARQLHFTWFLQSAERAGQDLYGPDQETALTRLDAELDNMRVALDFGRTSAALRDGHLLLSGALWPYWLLRGLFSEGREHLAFALHHADDAPPQIRARALLGAATLANAQWEITTARSNAEECLALYRAIDDPKGIADALLCLGYAAFINATYIHSDYAEAQQYLDEGIAICRRIGYQHGLVGALVRLGFLLMRLKHFEAARPVLLECLSASQALGAESSTAESLYNLGRLARCDGDFNTALDLLEQSLAISRRLGHLDSISAALLDIALVAVERGDLEDARKPLDEFVEIWRRLGNPVRAAWGLVMIGNIAYRQADYGAAWPWYLESLKIFREYKNQVGIACTCNSLGSVAFHQADFARARNLHIEALIIYHDLTLMDGMTWSLERLGVLEAFLGNPQEAVRLCGAASTAREELGVSLEPWDQADWDQAIAAIRAALGQAFDAAWAAGRLLTFDQIRSSLSDRGRVPTEGQRL